MSNMSEEEIIKIIKKELTFFRCTADDIKFKDAIKGLLDLYNKEKEKNKELEEENKILTKQLNSAFDRGFIHKDKIREILNIYNTSNSEFATLPNGKEIVLSDNGPLAEYLEELLGETDEKL